MSNTGRGRGSAQLLTGLGNPTEGTDRVNSQVTLALQAAWEIDLWGKVRNTSAAMREQVLASEAGQRGHDAQPCRTDGLRLYQSAQL